MPGLSSYDYAIVRVVPRVDRGECINAGVILYCRTEDFLGARSELDRPRLAALAPQADASLIEEHLRALTRICAGGAQAAAMGQLSQAERFHWLVAPRSTVIQPSPVHSGLCEDPVKALDYLFHVLVRPS